MRPRDYPPRFLIDSKALTARLRTKGQSLPSRYRLVLDKTSATRSALRSDPPDAAPATPSWFLEAIGQQPQHHWITTNGIRIHLRAWGDPQNAPLVLVHGGGAHSGWWDHVAPFFTSTHYVVALDLSGHGDSDQRTVYTLSAWAREVLAAATLTRSSARPTLVGHSMGGWVAAIAALQFGGQLNGACVVDSPLMEDAPEEQLFRKRSDTPRGYGTREKIIQRFRPVPDQRSVLPYVARHIATQSVRKGDGGWFWKFDPAIFVEHGVTDPSPDRRNLEHILDGIACRIAYFRCENGAIPDDMAERIREILELRGPFVEIACAGHHPMLDEPLALVATVRTLIEVWSIT